MPEIPTNYTEVIQRDRADQTPPRGPLVEAIRANAALKEKYLKIRRADSIGDEEGRSKEFQKIKGEILAEIAERQALLEIELPDSDEATALLEEVGDWNYMMAEMVLPKSPEADKSYESSRRAILFELNRIEETEAGGENLRNRFDSLELQIEDLKKAAESSGDPELIDDSKRMDQEFTARKLLYFQWSFLKPYTFGKTRVPPDSEKTTSDQMPLSGNQIVWMIREGIRPSERFPDDGYTNIVEDKNATLPVISKTRPGRFILNEGYTEIDESEPFDKTAVGDVMRLIDAIYLGKVEAKTGAGREIPVNSIHEYEQDILTFLENETGYNRTLIRNTFRLHWMVTFHQSYLVPESSPTVADNYFYMFKWLRYFTKYTLRETDSYLDELTMLMYGMNGASYFIGPQDESKIKRLLSDAKIDVKDHKYEHAEHEAKEHTTGTFGKLRNSLMGVPVEKGHGHKERVSLWDDSEIRREKKGFSNYRWIMRPLFNLRSRMNNLSEDYGRKDDGFCVAPPLVYFLLRDEAGKVIRKQPPEGSAPGAKGAIMTFDDIRSTEDEYIYEQMPFDKLPGSALLAYMQDLHSGPFKVLGNILKGDPEAVVKLGSSEEGLKKIKNMYVYLVNFLPYVGPEIMNGNKDLNNQVLDQLMLITIISIIMEETEVTKAHFWGKVEVENYLNKAVRAQVIDSEDKEFIMKVTADRKFWQLALRSYARGLQEQIKNAFKLR